MADSLGLSEPLDTDLEMIRRLGVDESTQHLLLVVQIARNFQTVLKKLSDLEQKMSDQIAALTAEVASTAAVETAAAAVIEAALSAEATLKDQLSKATDPADQAALTDATNKLAAARAVLQSEVDKANAANPPASTAAPAASPADAGSTVAPAASAGDAPAAT